MTARIIDGRKHARAVEENVRAQVEEIRAAGGLPPRLDVILIGKDAASDVYVKRKQSACTRVGIDARLHRIDETESRQRAVDLIRELNNDDSVTGILIQLPLPPGFHPPTLLPLVDPDKDVDGLHPINQGRLSNGQAGLVPATPRGIIHLLDAEGLALEGANVVIVNHSNLVGRPLAQLCLSREATVTVCHKATQQLAGHTRQADVLVTAAGVPGLITRKHVARGAVVIDAGISRQGDNVVGDVAAGVERVAQAITPVPGGVGPMTVAMLLANVVEADRLQREGGRA